MSNRERPSQNASHDDARLVLTSAQRVGAPPDEAPEAERNTTVPPPDAEVQPPSDQEAALRALVAEIVREELRGPLGERMTRNLRKLVRREISRALAMRDTR